MEMNKFYFLTSQSHWSSPLLGNKPKKFNFIHQTVSRWEACTSGAQDQLKPYCAIAKSATFSTPLGFQFCQEDGPLLMLGPILLIMHNKSSKFGGLYPTK